jgi:hypothetical protein
MMVKKIDVEILMGLQDLAPVNENVVHIRKSCNAEKIYPVILMVLHVVSPLEYKKVGSGMPSVCIYVCAHH